MALSRPAPAPSDEFDLVYRREMGFVWRVLRYHGVPPSAVEDAVQDVFMVVYRRWQDWDQDRSLRSWLFGIARRVAATSRRGASRHQRKLAAVPEPAAATSLDEQAADRETLRRLALVLEQLDHKLAAVFMLADIEGLSAPEIARELGVNLNTVYWRLRSARARVNQAMAVQECRP
ncbi:RNA polymerase sigma factor CnrH [Enhygromyxa salina]|uniref:RNA polymerase sigma factor CnrH n=1 Tax=Enhygromyxa salina TaxID=215803 RepID=A0A2S9YDZ0_9BACT|nr:sigma-70 family RNA polymerase sigma factor [Enhygromyxa salina]PRQ03252.1 RNA polymerase sigma factor CnrH [Enhygromyxa salina]